MVNGTQVLFQQTGISEPIYFDYDANGHPYSMTYSNTKSFYLCNQYGDVLALLNESGDKIVEYTYGPYGQILSVTGSHANTLGAINPFRYRGYYYDTETGLYYLNSRYYDPEVGRFINADGVIDPTSVLGTNLYAYCGNNPINRVDPTGHFWKEIGNWFRNVGNTIKNILQGVTKDYQNISNTTTAITKKASSLPQKGKPGSSQTLPNSDGTPKQKRWYGPDGNPIRDRDYNHPGNVPFPHDHEWKDGKRSPEHLPPSPEYEFTMEPIIGVGIVAICTVAIVVVAADDVTGVGIADDFLFGPLGVGLGKGIIMIFG